MPRLFTYLLCGAIAATVAGGLGGSFQPARIIIAVAAVLAAVLATTVTDGPVIARARGTSYIMVLFGAASLFWTNDVIGGLGLVIAVATGALSFYVVARGDLGYPGVRWLMWAWVIAVCASFPVAYYEIATGNHFSVLDERNIGGNFGQFPFASVFFGNYNDYSAWLCLAFPITMSLFLGAESVKERAFLTAVNGLTVLVIFINTSRVALAYAGIIILLYITISNRLRRYAAVAFALSLPVIIVKYQEQIFDIWNLAVYRFQVSTLVDDSYIQRSKLLEAGLTALRDSFGMGIGAGSFDEYINDYYTYLIPNPHNLFLEIAINFGVIPLVAFVVLLIGVLAAGFRRRDLPMEFRTAIVFGVGAVPLIGIIPSQAVGYVYWWLWLATMVAMASARMQPQDGPEPG